MSDTQSQEVVSVADVAVPGAYQQVASLNRGEVPVWSSIKGDSFAERAATFAAISSAEPLRDHLNETIALRHVVAQAVTVNDDDTDSGRSEAVRVILIATDGTAYAAVSNVIFNSVKDLIAIMGHPSTWPEPVPVHAVQEGSGNRRYFTLKLGTAKTAK